MGNSSIDYESIFKYAFDNATIGIAISSLDGRIMKANSTVCKIFGYCEEELIQMSYENFTHRDDLERNTQLINEILAGYRDTYNIEKRVFRKNGEIIWLKVSVYLITNKLDEPDYFISQVEDITDKKNVELKLHEVDRQNQLIAENSLDIIAIHKPDRTCLFISSACYLLLGYHPKELMGKNACKLYHPDDLKIVKAKFEKINRNNEVYPFQFRMRVKSGEYRWFETTAKGIMGEDQKIVEILSFTRDVTARKESELRLKESEVRYKSLFDYHPDMIFSMDLKGKYTSMNRAFERMMGYTEREVLQNNYSF